MMLKFVRYWLPSLVVAGGLLVIAIGGDEIALEGGAAIIGAGLSIALLNFLYRIGEKGDRERDQEVEARRFFDEHGYWPDDPR
jgi:hypothetical protein